jgi:hypothetical protein
MLWFCTDDGYYKLLILYFTFLQYVCARILYLYSVLLIVFTGMYSGYLYLITSNPLEVLTIEQFVNFYVSYVLEPMWGHICSRLNFHNLFTYCFYYLIILFP